MTFSILIIDCTGKPYNAVNQAALALGGIERTIIQLSDALAKKGNSVTVWNHTPEPTSAGNAAWVPKGRHDLLEKYDIVIACNDPCLFDEYAKTSGHRNFKPYLWFHNRVLLEKTIRKGRMGPLLRWKPVGVFLGRDHESAATKFIPLRRRVIIGHGLEREVLDFDSGADSLRPPVAVFYSQAYRGLSDVISLWMDKIHPALPQARLRVYADVKSIMKGPGETEETGVEIRGRLPRKDLMQELKDARVCLIPGHADETFCLAAAEALAMNIPVLTYGTGALKERVSDGKNGYIAAGEKHFAERLKNILEDGALWHKLSAHGLPDKEQYDWGHVAEHWLTLFGER